jgi:thiamine biosynthesis lipoprotein
VAGARPDGWCIQVAEREGDDGQLVLVRQGGLATSTTTVRTWRRGERQLHHIVDPATGQPARGRWRTVSVAAASALAANVASTAAIVRGADAIDRLTREGLAARLVASDGSVVTTPGWPGHSDRILLAERRCGATAASPTAASPTATSPTEETRIRTGGNLR